MSSGVRLQISVNHSSQVHIATPTANTMEQSEEMSRVTTMKIRVPRQAVAKKKRHSSRSQYTCNICGKMVDDKYKLGHHIKRCHLKGCTCEECPEPECSFKDSSLKYVECEMKVLMHLNKVHYKRGKKQDGANSQAASPPAADIPVQSTSAPSTATTPTNVIWREGSMTQNEGKVELKRLLQSYLEEAMSEGGHQKVRTLIRALLFSALEPEDFVSELKKEINLSSNSYLVPFIKESLPHLQVAVYCGGLVIDGLNLPASSKATTSMNAAAMALNMTPAEYQKKMESYLKLYKMEGQQGITQLLALQKTDPTSKVLYQQMIALLSRKNKKVKTVSLH